MTAAENQIERFEKRPNETSDRLRFIEKRSTSMNLTPHELVRMLTTAIDEYMPRSDPSWLLRRIF